MQKPLLKCFFLSIDRHLGSRSFLLIAIAGFVFLLTNAGCGHITPYYGPNDSLPPEYMTTDEDVKYRILLIGDAGEPNKEKDEPVLQTLRQWAEVMPQKTMIIFLGDNIYERGMPQKRDTDAREEAERRLLAQLRVVKANEAHGLRGLFIPGNHDWAKGGKDGQETVKQQAQYVNQILSDNENFLPKGGCPGPAMPTMVDKHGVRVIVLDTQWWLHNKEWKPTILCPQGDKDAVINKLKDLLQSGEDQQVMVVAHHPLASHGPHGGFFDWKDHLFPVTHLVEWLWIPTPIVGSLYPIARQHWVKHKQDLAGSDNKDMVRRLKKALEEVRSKTKPLIYAAGHEHSLQVLRGDSAHYILVSGAGSKAKVTPVSHGDDTLFAHSHPGFMAVDFMKDRRVLLRVIEPGGKGVVFLKWLDTNG